MDEFKKDDLVMVSCSEIDWGVPRHQFDVFAVWGVVVDFTDCGVIVKHGSWDLDDCFLLAVATETYHYRPECLTKLGKL